MPDYLIARLSDCLIIPRWIDSPDCSIGAQVMQMLRALPAEQRRLRPVDEGELRRRAEAREARRVRYM